MEKIYEIISEPISEWLKEFGIIISKEFVLILLIAFGLLFSYVIEKAFSHINKITAKKKSKSLHPFFNYDEIDNARSNYIKQNFQNIAPSKEDELIYTHSSVAKQPLIKFFLNSFSDKSDKRFFILLADSGMGKTARISCRPWFSSDLPSPSASSSGSSLATSKPGLKYSRLWSGSALRILTISESVSNISSMMSSSSSSTRSSTRLNFK